MIRWLGKWLGRFLLLLSVICLGLIAPVLYVETACRGEPVQDAYHPLLPPEHHRAEARSFLTYPEWHIVHAYDDYAKVISAGDPHEFGYTRAVTQFWSSLCALSEKSAAHGGFDRETKQMVYVIGVSFTAELGLKALYEETLGRVATWVRGEARSVLDDLSADQAASYAEFLQQVPWYKWDFRGDVAALNAAATSAFRDQERRFALGLEFGAKASYAQVIAEAVANVGADELTLRLIVNGPIPELDGVRVISQSASGTVIEAPRYRALTELLVEMANQGVEFVEIAGNDDIMLTVLSSDAQFAGALFSFERQGYGDMRHLVQTKISGLAKLLRDLSQGAARLEHVHDY